MIMPQVAFDTLEYTKELEEAGVEPKIAEAQARAQVRVLSNLIDNQVATKENIKDLKGDVRELKSDIKVLNIKIDQVHNELDAKIDSLEQKLSMKLGKLGWVGFGFLAALITVYHFI